MIVSFSTVSLCEVSKMSNETAQEILKLVESGLLEQAFNKGAEGLHASPGNNDILSALYELTAVLRSKAMSFASKKANYSSISSEEVLLKRVNDLTQQDMYGNFR